LNVLVDDNDDGYRKQFATWASGLGAVRNPKLWEPLILSEAGTAGGPQ